MAEAAGARSRGAPSGAGDRLLPEEACAFIVEHETGGRAYYERRARTPHFPGSSSGLTIGCGWDLGYNDEAALVREWGSVLPAQTLAALRQALGLRAIDPGRTDNVARIERLKQELAWIAVPFDDAVAVFERHTLPRFCALARQAFPGFERLPPLCQGALVSLVFNRGTSMRGASRVEMKTIRDMVERGEIRGVPDEIRKMKRLWPNSPGLQRRRDAEAALFERGLAQQQA